MNIRDSFKKATLTTILATSLILPGCGRDSKNDLQESWEKPAKIEQVQPIKSEESLENKWLEGRYVMHSSGGEERYGDSWTAAYFLAPAKILNNKKNEYFLYSAKILSEIYGKPSGLYLQSRKIGNEEPYVDLGMMGGKIKLTPHINSSDDIGEFYLRMNYSENKKDKWKIEIIADKEFVKIYEKLNITLATHNYADNTIPPGIEGRIEESKWEKQWFKPVYKKEINSNFECLFFNIGSNEQMRNLIKNLVAQRGEASATRIIENANLKNIISITPR